VNEDAQAAIVLALGALALRLGLTDAHLAYIRPSMGPALAIAGAVLVVLGGVVLLRPGRTAAADEIGADDAGHAHAAHAHADAAHAGPDHAGASRVAWLLVAPVLAIAIVVPRPLGAFAANRAAATLPPSARADFGPLPPPAVPGGPVDLSLKDFVGRATYGQGRSLAGAPVRLTGFVTTDARGGGFLLTRFIVTCCAADARPLRVAIRGLAPPWPASGTWLEITGTWRPERRTAEDQRPPVLDATALHPIAAPANSYLR
jgi:putative membrane protein